MGWLKNWQGSFSFLAFSLAADSYTTALESVFGLRLGRVVILHERGITACFLEEDSVETACGRLLERGSESVVLWAQGQQKTGKRCLELFSEGREIDTETFRAVRTAIETYAAHQNGLKELANHLPQGWVREFAALREARLETERIFPSLERWTQGFVAAVAERSGRDEEELSALTAGEAEAYLTHGGLPDSATLMARFSSSGMILDDEWRPLSEEEIRVFTDGLKTEEDVAKGQCAYPGKAAGRARVVRDFRTASLEKGEILITGMTDPDSVPLMERAGAIVTDAGGVLCHAAIVSREMRKPCVTGTGNATAVFKDGDLVEVDAEKGTVRKLLG